MNIVNGDLIVLAEQGEFDVIVQGCNCYCVMGGGIAKQIKTKYPFAYSADLATIKGDYNKLGTYTYVNTGKFIIVNAYTQFNFNVNGDRKDLFEYIAFILILQKLNHEFPGKRIGFPKIGSGLAGGDENYITELLDDFSLEYEKTGGTVTLVEFV